MSDSQAPQANADAAPRPSRCYVAKFDDYPLLNGEVEVIYADGDLQLWIAVGDVRELVLSASRDQWGVFVSTTGVTIAQEDGTRSFIDALIQALQFVRTSCECDTKPADVTST